MNNETPGSATSDGAHPDPVGRKAPDVDLGAELSPGSAPPELADALAAWWEAPDTASDLPPLTQAFIDGWRACYERPALSAVVPGQRLTLHATDDLLRAAEGLRDAPGVIERVPEQCCVAERPLGTCGQPRDAASHTADRFHGGTHDFVPPASEQRGAVPPGGDDLRARALEFLAVAERNEAATTEPVRSTWAAKAALLRIALAGIQRGRPTFSEDDVERASGAMYDARMANDDVRFAELARAALSAVGIVEGQATDGGQG